MTKLMTKIVLVILVVSSYVFTAPVISNIQWYTANSTSVTVTWNTDVPATTQVQYRYFTQFSAYSWGTYTGTTLVTDLTTTHTVAISMSINTYAYSFYPVSKDGANLTTNGPNIVIPGGFESYFYDYGNHTSYSGNSKLLMLDGYDTSKATIKYLTGPDTVTNYYAYVEYGTTTAYGSNSTIVTTTHSFAVKLSGLTAGQTYHYRLRYSNDYGSGKGTDYTFSVPVNASTITPSQIIVLKNASSATSVTIADYYAAKRNIPAENVVTVTGISDYSGRWSGSIASTSATWLTIKSQLKAVLDANGGSLKNSVRYIVDEQAIDRLMVGRDVIK